ncbi:glutathione S-transferase N-terminal domain-containing protein [Oceanimonas sp. NS1]|nr:glutathione S-transferase N-terminal domain-containing protein [Oceanimonas sp. NS1]
MNLRAGEQRQNDYRALNPAAGVPLLVDDEGNGLGQSLAIIDYLEALHPEPPLLPAEPLLRARALELANLIACDIHPVNNLRVRNYLANELSLVRTSRSAGTGTGSPRAWRPPKHCWCATALAIIVLAMRPRWRIVAWCLRWPMVFA